MNTIRSTIYTPNEITLAHTLADALDDRKS